MFRRLPAVGFLVVVVVVVVVDVVFDGGGGGVVVIAVLAVAAHEGAVPLPCRDQRDTEQVQLRRRGG
jgi:hypothetical protein